MMMPIANTTVANPNKHNSLTPVGGVTEVHIRTDCMGCVKGEGLLLVYP